MMYFINVFRLLVLSLYLYLCCLLYIAFGLFFRFSHGFTMKYIMKIINHVFFSGFFILCFISRNMVNGLWFMVHGSWFTVHGLSFTVYVHGPRFKVHGSRFMVHSTLSVLITNTSYQHGYLKNKFFTKYSFISFSQLLIFTCSSAYEQ